MPMNHDTSTGLFSRKCVFVHAWLSPNSELDSKHLRGSIGVSVASSVNAEKHAQRCSLGTT
jgi:hypothetical protein